MQLTNFRDLGGFIGFNGTTVKNKLLFRAGQPVGLSEADVEKLKNEYLLAHIIDFRGASEVTKYPIDDIEGVKYLNIDILASHMQDEKNVPCLEDILKNLKPGYADNFMNKVYVDLVDCEDASSGYRAFLRYLIENDGSTMFHCYAGKDRTGWGAAILLKILGVSDEDIFADYLKTVEGRKEANSMIIEGMRAKGLTEGQLKDFECMMSVKTLYLRTALNTVEEKYGDFENYLKFALEINDEEIQILRSKYLA